MTESANDSTLAWTRELGADASQSAEPPEAALRALGITDPEAEVLAAMAPLPAHVQQYVAEVVERIAEEASANPDVQPSSGRHRRPTETPG